MHAPLDLIKPISKALEDVARTNTEREYPKAEVLLTWFRDRKKAIRDPIYDQITLNELERAVLRTAEFQRLRWVRQMDFAYMVYPAAEHSRFVHSLGVCQAAKDLFDTVFANRSEGLMAGAEAQSLNRTERTSIPDFCLFDRVLVSLAALLHDLAHPAFSHAFDTRDDMVKHDDYEHNPFMLRALFDLDSSELARVLAKWDPYFQVLVRAEAPQLFPESAHTSEGMQTHLPSLATLIFEILSIQSTDDLGSSYKCLAPAGAKTELDSIELAAVAGSGWTNSPITFSTPTVRTSQLFRRLHCDIVANTISADLMDYIRRDTRLAGLPRDLDQRFYSYISCGDYRKRQRVVVELQDRHGHVRRDALSDLMNCMEIRYIIHERIVLHRSVVAARSMAARLHPPIAEPAEQVWSIVEKMYGSWGKWYSDAELLGTVPPIGTINQDMAVLLRKRQLYRPIVIVDAERLRRHNVTLTDEAKKRLAAKFGGLGDTDNAVAGNHWGQLIKLESLINQEVLDDVGETAKRRILRETQSAPLSFAACMKPSVLFKNPRILVRVPTGLTRPQPDTESQVETLDLWLSQVIPLSTHEADQGMYAQIRALNMRYGELWRLYICAHPALFTSDVGRVLLTRLKSRWEKEIVDEAAIPEMPPNVAAEDLRTQDVIDRIKDQRMADILLLTLQLFPTLDLVDAEQAIARAGTSVNEVASRLEARKREYGTAGMAAKAKGPAISGAKGQAIREFETCLRGEDRKKEEARSTPGLFGNTGDEDESTRSR